MKHDSSFSFVIYASRCEKDMEEKSNKNQNCKNKMTSKYLSQVLLLFPWNQRQVGEKDGNSWHLIAVKRVLEKKK